MLQGELTAKLSETPKIQHKQVDSSKSDPSVLSIKEVWQNLFFFFFNQSLYHCTFVKLLGDQNLPPLEVDMT